MENVKQTEGSTQGNRILPDYPALFIVLSRRSGASAPLGFRANDGAGAQRANALKLDRTQTIIARSRDRPEGRTQKLLQFRHKERVNCRSC
jgi:hypothetical protein